MSIQHFEVTWGGGSITPVLIQSLLVGYFQKKYQQPGFNLAVREYSVTISNNDIFVVMWQDRHSDTTATFFRDLAIAKEWALKQAHETSSDGEINIKKIAGRELYVEYSCEGDCLWIDKI